MEKILAVVFSCLFFSSANGQTESSQKEDYTSLYLATIENLDYLKSSNEPQYFELTENTEKIKDKITVKNITFPTGKELTKLALKEKNGLTIWRVVHKVIADDTVDINIGPVDYTARRGVFFYNGRPYFTKINLAISCGGTERYQPTQRFAFDHVKQEWNAIAYVKPKTFRERLLEEQQKMKNN
ncbi:hypothetical protein FVR03_09070 [Pontibacter qinzhouensis]|uniref:Uncharacterized protein n=1 Tax=Pontibacter qinzhouensis TaxID=2603253 RepID=A0A5C8KC32_9BACT|nr:hypothetical protein [Pontibacter qinzhouensis]TXK47685.1 hypothetical protein FVR03_09070 [Pontibacter qinzhouensis]